MFGHALKKLIHAHVLLMGVFESPVGALIIVTIADRLMALKGRLDAHTAGEAVLTTVAGGCRLEGFLRG